MIEPIINTTSPITVNKVAEKKYNIYILSCCLILLLLIIYNLFLLLSRYHTQKSVDSLRNNDLTSVDRSLLLAKKWLPSIALYNDKKRISLAKGETLLKHAKSATKISAVYEYNAKARKVFAEVVDKVPIDLDGQIGLAKATEVLQRVHPFLKREAFETSAEPIFRKILQLMPTNLYAHSLLTRYYQVRGMEPELNKLIIDTVTIYPPIYNQLKHQPFYRDKLDTEIESGLLKAIENDIFVEQAYDALVQLAEKERDYTQAIDYLLSAPPVDLIEIDTTYYLRLAKLYLAASLYSEAESVFLQVLNSSQRDELLKKIWKYYREKERYQEFIQFIERAEDLYQLSSKSKIYAAEGLIELGEYQMANRYLTSIESPMLLGESLYHQARVAEHLQDWDVMELLSQKATVKEPSNHKYYLLFSNALAKQGKFEQAEYAADMALHVTKEPLAHLFNHRGWLRWHRKEPNGALEDWLKAIQIAPNMASYQFNVGRGYQGVGKREKAIQHVTNAIELEPSNKRYLEKLEILRKGMRLQTENGKTQ